MSSPSGVLVQTPGSARRSSSWFTGAFAIVKAVSIARGSRPEWSPHGRRRREERADGAEVDLRVLDVAHMAAARNYDQLAAADSLVEDAGGARGRRAVVLADDDERRRLDAREVRHVVEVAVALVREVAQDVG